MNVQPGMDISLNRSIQVTKGNRNQNTTMRQHDEVPDAHHHYTESNTDGVFKIIQQRIR